MSIAQNTIDGSENKGIENKDRFAEKEKSLVKINS